MPGKSPALIQERANKGDLMLRVTPNPLDNTLPSMQSGAYPSGSTLTEGCKLGVL